MFKICTLCVEITYQTREEKIKPTNKGTKADLPCKAFNPMNYLSCQSLFNYDDIDEYKIDLA